jgi:tetratricopeptide (TPR) repeat protein
MFTDLATMPVAETLRRLSAARKSGDLQVRSGKVVKTVFFDHGRIVFAASNVKKDRLGEALVAIGRITDEEFDRASALMKGDRKRRFGEALVHAGVLEKDELGRMVSRQVKRIVLSIFEFSEGAASFEERVCPIPLEYMVSLSLHRVLYMGIREMDNQRLILEGLGDLDRWVKLAAVPPFPFGVKKCTAEELDVLDQAKRKVTLRRLGWAPGGLSTARLRAAYALLASGVLEDAERPGGEPQPIIHMETSTFLLSALQRKPDPSVRDAIQQEVADELERSNSLDRDKWLKVSGSAPRDVLVKALEEKMERYHALLDAIADDDGLKTDIEVILGRASTMLRLTKHAPPPAPPPASPPPPEEPAPEPESSDAAPATAPEPPPTETKPALPPEPPKAEPAAESAPTGHGGGSGAFEGSAQIEYLLMEANVRMTVSDFANAVRVYAKVVDLAPKVAAYRLRLAIAMTRYPGTQKQAELEFLEATRLDPDNADLHFQFAKYYQSMKVRSRAIAELRTAVKLNPRHRQAREELESLSPKDGALTSLKKLFR